MNEVSIKNISFSYANSDRLILENINLEVEAGDFVCLLGQSGCGKSTLLRLLAGLEKPTTGTITVGGKPVQGAGLDRSVVFQDYGLFPWMTAGDNILLALEQKFPEKSKSELQEVTKQALQNVGLKPEVYHKYPKELSGGMKQRCAIARSFSMDSPVLLMDEPFGALDAVTRAMLQDMLLELWAKDEKKKTVFFVTHDVDEAILLGSRICVLGQSPSQIICEKLIPEDEKPERKHLYEKEEILTLRNTLIRSINDNVSQRI